ncbi:MAG: hypothetical protein QM784_38705 [Polyangiaceae bacterium]
MTTRSSEKFMRDPEIFKFDVRVRERMLKSGRLSSDELATQLESLSDVEENAIALELDQPALGRADGASLNRPSIAPPTLSTADRDPEATVGSNS